MASKADSALLFLMEEAGVSADTQEKNTRRALTRCYLRGLMKPLPVYAQP